MECVSCAIKSSDTCLVPGLCIEKIRAYDSVENNVVFIIGVCRDKQRRAALCQVLSLVDEAVLMLSL